MRAKARKTLKQLNEKLNKDDHNNSVVESPLYVKSMSNESVTTATKVRGKLPKLEVKKFKGDVCKQQEFWDSFESSIHSSDCLSDVDKLNYLKGLLEESAKSCILGFSLTAANYNSAVDILKERYGKKSAVQHAHMQQLMKTEHVKWTGEERHVTFIFLRLRNVKLMCIVHTQKLSLLFFRKHAFVKLSK